MPSSKVIDFIEYISQQRRYSPLTVQQYQSDLIRFEQFISQFNLPAESFSRLEIRSFIAHEMKLGLHPNSVNRRLSVLKSFFRYLVLIEFRKDNPAHSVVAPKKPKRLPVFISETQLQDMLQKISYSNDFSGIRDKTLMETLYQTGMRRAELIQLKDLDVNTAQMQLKVLGKRNKERILPFGNSLAQQFLNYKTAKLKSGFSSPYFFLTNQGKPLYPVFVQRIVQRVLNQITTVHQKSPHVLRHSFATHMLNAGADINAVKELLGHQSLAATQVYTHNSIEQLKNSYGQAHPRSGQ